MISQLYQGNEIFSALCVQLLDLRSHIVVDKSQKIVAFATNLDVTQAIKMLFDALGGVVVK